MLLVFNHELHHATDSASGSSTSEGGSIRGCMSRYIHDDISNGVNSSMNGGVSSGSSRADQCEVEELQLLAVGCTKN